MKKFLFVLSILVLAGASLSACNTVEGFGQDLESAGEGLQKSSAKNKNY